MSDNMKNKSGDWRAKTERKNRSENGSRKFCGLKGEKIESDKQFDTQSRGVNSNQ